MIWLSDDINIYLILALWWWRDILEVCVDKMHGIRENV